MSYTDDEERTEATERADRYFEIQGMDIPDHNSEEWQEVYYHKYDNILNNPL